MSKEPRAELDVDPVRGVREEIGAQAADDRFENSDGDKADDQNIERSDAAMNQDLVDDDLKEEWRNEGEDLQKEGRDQHLAQEPPVFVDGAQEPRDVEAA